MRCSIPWALTITLVAVRLVGHSPEPSDLNRLTQELEDTVRGQDLIKAADLAAKLDDAVQRQFRASLNRDADQRVTEVLTWLPSDTEALLVLQEPTVIEATPSPATFDGKPAQSYAMDRLMALNDGQFRGQLQGRTVRLTVAAIKNIRSRGMGAVPALMPDGDVAYFYFFSEPIEAAAFGRPEESVNMHPLWRGSAKIDTGEPWTPEVGEPSQRADESWLTLARPDLLVMSSRREMVIELLGRIGQVRQNPRERALPDTLAEWAQIDRRAPFWGLRHYSEPGSRRDISNPKSRTPEEAEADSLAIGVTFRFDMDPGNLEIRYLTGTPNLPRLFARRAFDREFQSVQVRPGVWQFKSNIRDRGDFPFHLGAYLLGFGGYR